MPRQTKRRMAVEVSPIGELETDSLLKNKQSSGLYGFLDSKDLCFSPKGQARA